MNRRKALRQTAIWAGSTIAAPSFLSLLQACKQQDRLNWKPLFFSDDQAKLVGALIDTILPRTETPGGLDVKVDVFIDLLIDKTYSQEAKEQYAKELYNFNAACKNSHGKYFTALDQKQRVKVLEEEEKHPGKFSPSVWGTAVGSPDEVSFYRRFKSTALWAYFTSEEIGKNQLNYDPIPGEYSGCVPLDEVGRIWSL